MVKDRREDRAQELGLERRRREELDDGRDWWERAIRVAANAGDRHAMAGISRDEREDVAKVSSMKGGAECGKLMKLSIIPFGSQEIYFRQPRTHICLLPCIPTTYVCTIGRYWRT